MMTKLGSVAVALAAALSLAACSEAEAPPPVETTAVAPAPTDDGGEAGFEDTTQEETIQVGPMEVLVPLGIKLPEDSIVTSAERPSVMIADEDPQPVIDAVYASAKAAGYEIYAEPGPGRTIWVGHGNVVLLDAIPNAQILTWGPEAMKDALANA